MSHVFLWHGSDHQIEKFEGDALQGHVHLGSFDQAMMRSGSRHLHLVSAPSGNLMRIRDKGSDNLASIARARRQGHDGLIYLNRYEGIPYAEVEAFLQRFPKRDPDKISDAEFRKYFPSAQDSMISIDPHDCKVLAYIEDASSLKGWDLRAILEDNRYKGLLAREDLQITSGDPQRDLSTLLDLSDPGPAVEP